MLSCQRKKTFEKEGSVIENCWEFEKNEERGLFKGLVPRDGFIGILDRSDISKGGCSESCRGVTGRGCGGKAAGWSVQTTLECSSKGQLCFRRWLHSNMASSELIFPFNMWAFLWTDSTSTMNSREKVSKLVIADEIPSTRKRLILSRNSDYWCTKLANTAEFINTYGLW